MNTTLHANNMSMKNNTTAADASDNTSGLQQHVNNSLLLQIVILSIFAVFGLCGNILILVTGVRRLASCFGVHKIGTQEYKTSFIANLAVADILILAYGIPFHLVGEYMVPLDEFICRFIAPLRDVFSFISILTIMAISVERAVAIVNPFAHEMTQRHTRHGIILIWITAYLLVGLPMAFVMHSTESKMCFPRWHDPKLQKLHQTSAALFIVIPGLITTFSYMSCLRSLHKFRQRRKSNSDNTTIEQWTFIEQSRCVSRIAVVLVVVFWLCNLPLVIYAISLNNNIIHVSPKSVIYTRAVLLCMFFGASMINPVVLIVMSPVYRRGATDCLHFWFSKRNSTFGYNHETRNLSVSREPTSKSDQTSIANNEFLMARLQES